MPFILFSRKRKPWPEYESPNTWSDFFNKSRRANGLLDELEQTFNPKQMKLYEKYRETVLEVERAKPWQYSSVQKKEDK